MGKMASCGAFSNSPSLSAFIIEGKRLEKNIGVDL